MKGKAKFSAGGLKQFLLLHVEKLVLGVVCVLLLLLVYRGATRETLKAEQRPEALDRLASTVKQQVESSAWDPAQAEVTTINFVQEAQRNQALVDASAYSSKTKWIDVPTVTRRRDPDLLAAVDLQGRAGFGTFALIDPDYEAVMAAGDRVEAGAKEIEIDPETGRPIRGRRRNQDDAQGGGYGRGGAGYGPPAGGGRGGAGYGAPRGGAGGAGYGGARGGAGYGAPRGGAGYGAPRGGAGYGPPRAGAGGAGYGGAGYGGAGGAAGPEPTMVAPVGSKLQTRHWVSLVALVPIQKQNQEFVKALAGSEATYDPSSDYPNYIAYEVERIDVTNESPDAELEWSKKNPTYFKKTITPNVIEAETKLWSTESPELVNEMYLQQGLVFPLGPLLQKTWKRWATHPKIPLASMAGFEPPAEQEQEESKDLESLDAAAGDPADAGGYGGAPSYGGGGYGRAGGAGYGMPPRGGAGYGMPPRGGAGYGPPRGGGGYGGAGYGRAAGGYGGGYGRGGAGYGRAAGGGGYGYGGGMGMGEEMIQISHSLLRHFDFDVKPGRKYRYRVCMVLRDPNFGRPPAELVKPRAKMQKYRRSPYSDPSPVIAIPPDGDLLAGEVTTRSGEPTAKVMALSYVPEEKAEAAREVDVTRGMLANFPNQKVKVMKPSEPPPTTALATEEPKTVAAVDQTFRTDLFVVDIRGGDKLLNSKGRNSELTEPGEILLLGPDGRMFVRRELEDSSDYKFNKTNLETLEDTFRAESVPAGGEDTGRGAGPAGYGARGGRGG